MSHLTFINPPGLYNPTANGYSHVAVVQGSPRWVFIAGQGGELADGSLPAEFADQVDQALDNLVTALAAAGATLHDVIKFTVLVVDHTEDRLAVLSRALRERFEGRPAPACTLIPVPRLALDGMAIEIEATAVSRTTAG
ncbi:RidA family protein [Rhizobacter sp. Root1221]|uniref:RidA family protein n=1 Tax=Rhizobacter sp. Root1221 TaxID=1736433 RepID=UPI0006F20F7A|nr:RidA family protein [Rhizobacter sp. Root1221]KQV95183.1 hypothetical protein ASC87_25335 [Rhizobacter sp. Root1221]